MTMTLALALLAQATDMQPPQADVVVTGRNQYSWVRNISMNDGKAECKTEVSTGDNDRDNIMCSALSACSPEFQPQIDALTRPGIAAGTMKNSGDMVRATRPVLRAFNKCMADHRKPALRALATQRRVH